MAVATALRVAARFRLLGAMAVALLVTVVSVRKTVKSSRTSALRKPQVLQVGRVRVGDAEGVLALEHVGGTGRGSESFRRLNVAMLVGSSKHESFVKDAMTHHWDIRLHHPNLELADEADHGDRCHCEDNLNVRFR